MLDAANDPDTPPESPAALRPAYRPSPAVRFGLLGLLVLVVGLAAVEEMSLLAAGLVGLGLLALIAFRSRTGEEPADADGSGMQPLASSDSAMVGLADSLPFGCFLLTPDGIVLNANPPGRAAIPLRPGDSAITRLRAPEFLAAFDRVAAGGGPERIESVERLAPSRVFALWVAPLDTVVGGRPARIALILDDRTEIRSIERVRADFVANASHELRTPLASLSGFIETLMGPARDDPAARERFLGVMHEQATRMRRLIDDLLSLSRVEMAPAIRPGVEVDLTAILSHVADALAPLAAESGVAIELSAPSVPLLVPGNRDELVQLFENLVENACRYGASGKRVCIEVELPEGGRGEFVVGVRDFGPGIAAEHLPRLTERFYRVDAEDSRRHRGTGLGLAIVKHIAGRHRARLAIESKLGEGARFMVHFPQGRLAEPASTSQN